MTVAQAAALSGTCGHARECTGPEIPRRSRLARVTERGSARDDDKGLVHDGERAQWLAGSA